jgi:RNA polymerase sigma factor (sigma-70 family)
VNLPPFQRLVDEHWFAVARLAHALAGAVDGDDVAQQAWTQALAAYPGLRTAQNLRGWLLTITARCATDRYRTHRRREIPVGEVPDPDHGRATTRGHGAGTPDPPDGELWAAVRALPDRQRTAVALRYIADLDHAEIARALGTSPGASRRLVSDALAALRRTLPDLTAPAPGPPASSGPGPGGVTIPRETR